MKFVVDFDWETYCQRCPYFAKCSEDGVRNPTKALKCVLDATEPMPSIWIKPV